MRAKVHGYQLDRAAADMIGKADCGLVLTSLGHFLGFRVMGKQEWTGLVPPGQQNPSVDGAEIAMAYPGTRSGRMDYAWLDARQRVAAVFEVDGRDNSPNYHLPAAESVSPTRLICQHDRATNNLFKLSTGVLLKELGFVPPIRAWILFQVDNPRKMFRAKRNWIASPQEWRTYFSQCAELKGASVFGDSELFGNDFVDFVHDRLV